MKDADPEHCAVGRASTRLRILMLLENESYPDDTRVALECESLCRAGYRVTVICPTGLSRLRYECVQGVRVYRYPKPWELRGLIGYVWEYSYSLAAAFFISFYLLVRHGFDVVHAHAPPDMFVLIGGFYRLLGKRFVLDQHDLSPELYQARANGHGNRFVYAMLCLFERLACRAADRLIATNETQRRRQIERGRALPEHCHVVRNGPAAGFLKRVEPLESLRSDERLVVGYVGVIGVQDGVDYLLRALAHLRSDLCRDDVRAVIVGSGPALGGLRQLAKDLGIEQDVLFVGYRVGTDLLRHIASFDVCVTPDPSNPYNDSCTTVKSMEYMAMAKPVVAFDLPENRLTLADAALYATDNDARHLARQIARLIDQPAERVRLGRIGRQRVADHFMWERQQAKLIDVYRSLLPGAERRELRAADHREPVASLATGRRNDAATMTTGCELPLQPVDSAS